MADALFKRVEDAYVVTFIDHELEFTFDRLRWERHELFGQLTVACGLAGAKTILDGIVSAGSFNLTSPQARRTRAKEITERVRAKIDVIADLDEASQRVIAAERQGEPAIILRNVPRPPPDDEFDVDGLRFPKRHETIVFGDGDSLKSILALYVGGTLVLRGAHVAFFDWELDAQSHRDRLERIFGQDMPAIRYVRCERPLIHEVDRLRKIVRDEHLTFGIFDSVGFACPGPPENAEHALAYFRAVRHLKIGSYHIAHVRQPREGETTDATRPFGSAFWNNSARSTWFTKRASTSPDGRRVLLGLYNRKANLTGERPAIGFEVTFDGQRTHFDRLTVADVQELAEGLPMWQRMRQAVRHEPKTLARLAEELDAKVDTLDKTVRRKPDMFTRVSGVDGIVRISLVDRGAA